jgi:hypothetical protein
VPRVPDVRQHPTLQRGQSKGWFVPVNRRTAKTSIEILHERDALDRRLHELEATLATLRREVDHALEHPEANFLSVCRIATLLRRAEPQGPASGIRLARTRPGDAVRATG